MMTDSRLAREAAERLLARTITPTGTNLNLDIETVARFTLEMTDPDCRALCFALAHAVNDVERVKAAIVDGQADGHMFHAAVAKRDELLGKIFAWERYPELYRLLLARREKQS